MIRLAARALLPAAHSAARAAPTAARLHARAALSVAALHSAPAAPAAGHWAAAPARARIPARALAAAALPEHEVVPMPALSPTMESGTISEWLKEEGDVVNVGDIICRVETDKAVVDFEAQDEGVVAKILVAEGTSDVPIGTPIAVFVEETDMVAAFSGYTPTAEAAPAAAAAAPEPAPAAPAAAPAAPAAAPAKQSGDRVFASPLARKVARESGKDLAAIAGTGPRGRVVAADVEAFAGVAAAAADAVGAAPGSVTVTASASGDFTDVTHSGMRKTIAARLTEAKRTVPHYALTVELALDELMALREELNGELPEDERLSVNDFLIKASALAMKHRPEVNSSWQETFIRQFNNVDVCVAVSVPEGLVTPVVRGTEGKGLAAISGEVRRLAEAAREGALAPEAYSGGTFTISNLGMYGVSQFQAIINPPQACILAVGAAERKLVPDADAEGGFAAATAMRVTLSCDHRVVDGAVGAQWLAAFKGYIEKPKTMLL